VRILIWHVHGSWTTAFVQGAHDYVLPVLPDRGPDGRGRAETWDWPASVVERAPQALAAEPVDLVLLQRPHELELSCAWLGVTPGVDVPAVYVEHNTPGRDVPYTRHPLSSRSDIPIAHVTAFNALMWDTGAAPTTVIEHGIVDPGHRYRGDLPRMGACINEPVRRGRAVGTDLLLELAGQVPVELYGIGVEELSGAPGVRTHESLPQHDLHRMLARCAGYVHTARWTSLGLSLLEAMTLGLPVVALGATEVPRALPAGTGIVVASGVELRDACRRLLEDPEEARELGRRGREHARERYGLGRFLTDWDQLLHRLAG
jgi:glycosyltransferase involved in cell wall biosynthesis